MLKTILTQHRQVIGTFSSREAAGLAFDRLIISGFPLAQVFLVGQDTAKECQNSPELPSESWGTVNGTATGLKKGMVVGNLLGGASGLFLGFGLMALPGVGQLVLSSAIAFTLLSTGICTVVGGLSGALIGLGITSEQAKEYGQQIATGSFLLIVEGTAGEIERAKYLLKKSTV
jgi:hypothetical protein